MRMAVLLQEMVLSMDGVTANTQPVPPVEEQVFEDAAIEVEETTTEPVEGLAELDEEVRLATKGLPTDSYLALRRTLLKRGGHKTLTPEEKAAIIISAGRGDRHAAELLVILYDGFARQQAGKYATRRRMFANLDIEDLTQECRRGLLRAARDWDPARGAFTTYARWWLLNSMERAPNSGASLIDVPVHAHRKESTRKYIERTRRIESLDAPISEDDAAQGRERTLKDVLANEMRIDVTVHRDINRIDMLLSVVKPEERRAIERYYLDELTLAQIGEEEGVTRERIRQRIVNGIHKIQKHLRRKP